MTKPKPLAQVERLQKLQKRFGDVLLSEAIAKVRNPHIGAPRRWITFTLFEIFMGVEVIKAAAGVTTADARRAAAKFHRTTYDKVRHAHVEGRKRFAPILEQYDSEVVAKILRDHPNARPRLKRFLRTVKS